MGKENLSEGHQLVIGGGFKNAETAVQVAKGCCKDVPALKSDHEEADTSSYYMESMLLRVCQRIIVQSPDTNVVVL